MSEENIRFKNLKRSLKYLEDKYLGDAKSNDVLKETFMSIIKDVAKANIYLKDNEFITQEEAKQFHEDIYKVINKLNE